MGRKQGGLYTLELVDIVLPESVSDMLSKLSSFSFVNSVNSCNSASIIDSTSLWHSKLGHPSFQRLAILHSLVPDVINCSNNKSFDCPICPIAKKKRLPFQSSIHVSNSCFDLIHVDIWGPYSTPSLNGSKFFLTIVDDFNRCTWTFLMSQKSDVSHLIQSFYNLVVNQFNGLILVQNFPYILSMLLKVSYTNYLVLKHLNRPPLLRESTNIF